MTISGRWAECLPPLIFGGKIYVLQTCMQTLQSSGVVPGCRFYWRKLGDQSTRRFLQQWGEILYRCCTEHPATINAPVYITIGTGTTLYPLTKRNCAQVTACGIRTRTRYSVCVVTTPTGGSFRMLGSPCCAPNNNLTSIDGGSTVVPTAAVREVSK